MGYCYHLVPLQAKQVSKVNLHSEQGGINFTPFVLSLPYTKKKKKKKKKKKFPIWMGVSSKMSACCLSVCCLSLCLSVMSLSPIIFWIVGNGLLLSFGLCYQFQPVPKWSHQGAYIVYFLYTTVEAPKCAFLHNVVRSLHLT